MPGQYLEPPEWYATLPTVYVSACVLLTDRAGEQVLLVKPNYRDHWQVPGGVVDDGEPPHGAAVREVEEELGLRVDLGELLVVDWTAPSEDRPRPFLNFIWDGGAVEDPAMMTLQDDELDDARFWPWTDAARQLSPVTAPRIPAARRARESRQTIYLPAHAQTAGRAM